MPEQGQNMHPHIFKHCQLPSVTVIRISIHSMINIESTATFRHPAKGSLDAKLPRYEVLKMRENRCVENRWGSSPCIAKSHVSGSSKALNQVPFQCWFGLSVWVFLRPEKPSRNNVQKFESRWKNINEQKLEIMTNLKSINDHFQKLENH